MCVWLVWEGGGGRGKDLVVCGRVGPEPHCRQRTGSGRNQRKKLNTTSVYMSNCLYKQRVQYGLERCRLVRVPTDGLKLCPSVSCLWLRSHYSKLSLLFVDTTEG